MCWCHCCTSKDTCSAKPAVLTHHFCLYTSLLRWLCNCVCTCTPQCITLWMNWFAITDHSKSWHLSKNRAHFLPMTVWCVWCSNRGLVLPTLSLFLIDLCLAGEERPQPMHGQSLYLNQLCTHRGLFLSLVHDIVGDTWGTVKCLYVMCLKPQAVILRFILPSDARFELSFWLAVRWALWLSCTHL